MNESQHHDEPPGFFAVPVAVFAAFWVIGVIVASGGLPESPGPGYCMQLAAAWTLVAAPWALAVRLLRRRAGRVDPGDRRSTVDGPARLLALAVAALPEARRDWGPAMAAELDHLRGRSERWRFAAGCARTALFPPCGDRVPVLAVGTLAVAAVMLAGQAVDQALPAMRIFAMAFAALVGSLAVLGLSRSLRIMPTTAGLATTAGGLAGVAACVAVTGDFLIEYPMAEAHLPPASATLLATILAGSLWLVLAPPPALTSSPLARHIAVVTALVLGLGVVLASRLGLNHVAVFDTGLFAYLVLAPTLAIFATSAAVAAAERSFGAGLQTAAWTALFVSLAVFAFGLPEAILWYRVESSLIFSGDGIPIEAVGENLRGFVLGLILLPSWWLPFGVIGAAVGGRLRIEPLLESPCLEGS